MWTMIDSLQPFVDALAGAFTQPSYRSASQLLLGWVMCLGNHTLHRVAHSAQPQKPVDHSQRHGLDTAYNFFERSAWTPAGLAYHLAVLIFRQHVRQFRLACAAGQPPPFWPPAHADDRRQHRGRRGIRSSPPSPTAACGG